MLRFLYIFISFQIFAGQLMDHFEYIGNEAGIENVRFKINNLELSQDGQEYKFDYNYTGFIVEEGKPELPIFSTVIEVDPYTSYQLEYEIIHSYKEINKSIRAASELSLDKNKHEQGLERVLDISKKYPTEFVRIMEPKVMRGIEIIQIEVIPFQFDPSNQSLLVIEEIDIKLIPNKIRQPIRKREIPQNQSFNQILSNTILNFSRDEDQNSYYPPKILYICGGSLATNNSFQQLAEWRHKRGYEVEIVSVSEIGSNASSIKNYIQNAYNDWDNPPSFICLVGDATGTYTVPTFHENYSDYYGEGDHPFSLLDGPDQIPDVSVGRLPVRSTADMATLATKTLVYEKAIDMEDNWHEKAAIVGDPTDSGISTIITGEYIQQVMEYNQMEDIRTNYSNGNYSTWMRSQMSEGMLYFSYRGFYGVSGFTQSNIDNTTNGFKLPFCTFLTCGTGSFEDAGTDGGSVCFSEKLVVAGSAANPKGCVTAIATATWGTHTLFNNAVNLGIYEGIFTHNVETAGEALNSGKIHLLNTYPSNPYNYGTIFCYWNNLMGDPALHLWTDSPVIPVVGYDMEIPHGSNEIEFIVTDEFNNPISNAKVTLLKGNDEIFISRITDENGFVVIPLFYLNAGEVAVTITGKNIKPFEGSFLINDNMASVNIESSSIYIEELVSGNGDDLWSAGETINLYIPLRNFGNIDVNGIAATLTSESELISISTPGVSYGDISSGTVVQSFPFEVTASESTIDSEPLDLRLVIIDDQGQSWESSINVPISGGKFEVGDININGNNNYLSPDETSYLTLELRNIGTLGMNNISALLTPLNANIDVVTESVNDWGTIGPNEFSENITPFEIVVDDSYINGTNVSFTLEIFSSIIQTFIINMPIGQVTVNEPVGPDIYGYYIYDTGDVEYNLAPIYDWIEIDPGYGGDGIDLNITDNGDNQDESMVVDLPFLVRFYGQDYSQITVCSNGWISFGNTPMESFRNYPIPGAGGPSPMLAVFWDDLKTTNGGDIFSHYIPASENEIGKFVIEWSDVRTYDENSVESFQAIIYDNIADSPPFGDNEIKLQYKEFNNTSNGNYNFSWWDPPLHGAYCTVGIEDQSGTIGLQYTFDNEYNPAALPLSDGEALFITTRTGESFPPPTMEISHTEFSFDIGVDEIISGQFNFTNTGDQGSILIYFLDKIGFLNPGSISDQSGLMWSDSDREEDVDFEWVDITETGEEAYFLHNDVGTSPIELGFEFPLYGEIYSSCIINPNGWVGFGEDNDDNNNSGLPSANAPHPAVMGFWDDLNPISSDGGCSGNDSGIVYYQSFGDKFIVTYDNVPHCNGSGDGLYTFQIILTLSGRVYVNYHQMLGEVSSATVGIQNSNGYIGHEVIFNGDYVHDELSLIFDKSPDWLILNSPDSGQLYAGQTNTIDFSINSNGYATGNYAAYLNFNSNAGGAIILPFELNIDMGILGDVNDDSLINVSDIVLIVTFILEQNVPSSFQNWASDLNVDGSINVVDIVLLIEMILGN